MLYSNKITLLNDEYFDLNKFIGLFFSDTGDDRALKTHEKGTINQNRKMRGGHQ